MLVSEDKLIQFGQFLIQTFAQAKDIESIYVQKNTEIGITNDEDGPRLIEFSLSIKDSNKIQNKKCCRSGSN